LKIGAAFPSQYLKAADIGSARPVVTIDRVVMEDIGGDQKPILYFKGKEKGLVLNKTNANAIIGMTGNDETESWGGQRVAMFVTKVDFQGKRVDAIRIEDAPANGKTAPPPPPQDEDDSIPF
jgi:hypothetical protein